MCFSRKRISEHKQRAFKITRGQISPQAFQVSQIAIRRCKGQNTKSSKREEQCTTSIVNNRWVFTRHVLGCERVSPSLGWSQLVAQETPRVQTAKIQSQRRLKPSLPAHLSNQNIATQLLECQSFITQIILIAGFGGKLLWVWEIFFTILKTEYGAV